MDDQQQQHLIEEIRTWISLDEQMKSFQKKIRCLKQEKKKVTNTLVDIMRNNDIGEINISDGKLIYTSQKIKKSISKKYLTSILAQYFQHDSDKAEEVGAFILNNREETLRENIRRKIKK
jgi:prefoldin subunit 5